ncbi:MAG: helicase-exonuclease AddAB subunit AddA [Oscillospiraceae bacterium]|nr:helicase-exonuclease AddAB subunit AddA [Oscillospiraceae bacterium]
MPEWTKEQKKAIDSRDGSILVSAAAGSGKTAVLVQRVIERLKDENKPCSADRLLIVTFTRAATAQMKDRIYQALTAEIEKAPDNVHLKKQAVMLPFANISTIDSFCNDIVRENFHESDIAPDYGILDNSQLVLMRDDAVSKVLDELYNENSDEFIELVNLTANGADDSALSDLICRLYDGSMAFAQPVKYLDGLVEPYRSDAPLAEQPWGRTIISFAADSVEYCRLLCEKMLKACTEDAVVEEKYGAGVRNMLAEIQKLADILGNSSWDEIRNALNNASFGGFGRLPNKYSSTQSELVKDYKKTVTERIQKTAELFCASESENREDTQYLRPIAEKLIEAVKRYGEELSEQKKKVNGYDFSDICHFALNLLVKFDEDGTAHKTPLAESFSERFEEILVDEYQDVNDLQNTLFWAVSRGETNLFTVGDVKQSIYRFRQAMPEIFLSRRKGLDDYEDGNYPAKITLDRNFRSRSGVTENVNFLFSQIMSEKTGSVEYDEKEYLVAAADYEECDFPEAEMFVISDWEERVSRESEAQFIADKINEIISDGMTVRDKNGTRKASYRDFCILMRSANNGKAELYAKVLAENLIPAYVENKAGFFACAEISMMLSLMRVTDNPVQDVPLLAVLLSPVFGFTADELAQMRIDERKKPIYHCIVKAADGGNEKCRSFLEKLEELRMLSATLPCDRFIEEMYEKTGCKAIASAMKNGSQRSANLNMLIEYAAKYEESGKRGLSGFIRFIDRIQRRNSDLESAADVSEAADVVRIMTIHKSKGLEFPVCILADLNSRFNDDFAKSVAAYHPDLGICFDRRDSKRKRKYPTVGKKAIGIAEKISGRSEEMRVLYVAMTRAKERLICVTRYDNPEKKLAALRGELNEDKQILPFSLLSKSSMADWLLLGFLRHPDAASLWGGETPITLPATKRMSFETVYMLHDPIIIEEESESESADAELLAEIKRRTEYEYPYSELAGVMAKLAPSDLEATSFSTEYFASEKPRFLSKSGINPANRGTATHKFMEFFDYTAESFDVDAQIDRMVAEHYLTPDEAKALERDKLKKFFENDIALRIKNSPLLLREKKVTFGVRAGDIYPEFSGDAAEETIVVQGYVDCAFEENGGLVIVDYKTDRRIDDDTLITRYKNQLKMYEIALHECTGRKINGTVIYSFDLGKTVELK